MSTFCESVREQLGAYVDGELDPADRAIVSSHLDMCARCSDAVEAIREIGDRLRQHEPVLPEPRPLASLAASTIGRVRAEESQSWRMLLRRGVEDWHWALVGGGAFSAAVVSVLVAAAICAFGPRPEREDSLAALLNNLQATNGTLFMIATPIGPDQVPILMQVDNGEASVIDGVSATLPIGFSVPSGDDLALALSDAVVGKDGRMSDPRLMSQSARQQTDALWLEIQRLRTQPAASWSGRQVKVQKLGFVTNTSVSAKAL